MLSKSLIRLITSLQHKKFRRQHGLFCVEGVKSILEFVDSTYEVNMIFATSSAAAKLNKIPQNIKLVSVNEEELKKVSFLTNPQGALALVKIPSSERISTEQLSGKHSLILDDVQDPGNMGTIVRTAEWFGFTQVIASLDTVDVYNPKVVQATMGSLARMQIIYMDIEALIKETTIPSYGALLAGNSIYETDFKQEGMIILGNEGNGIRPTILPHITQAVTIPSFGRAESLNVAVAATVFCSEIARRKQTF
ncbi:RNA methyltransferase [Sphingobacterium sp. lm-10]|uniref:TrmH family RNA methyltransferase n=1 Tax=Sphingobacterium sp. lm-10 TaxID=2944904 RepID=UPI002021DD1D|nr:RNA methyltransferase [Sphingobacterium sp. lm-10]MCL7989245.1 RNA methyltransferase [Sphingobacterium sp. lm-10]